MLLDKTQVTQFLPHKDPFLFIDSVLKLEVPEGVEPKVPKDLVGTKVTCGFNVREDLVILKGHFPGNPLMPGVIQIEMMAQSSAFVSLPLIDFQLDGVDVETLLVTVAEAKFRKMLKPGMEVQVSATLTKLRGLIANYDCEIYCGEEKISEASLMAKLTINKKD
jgi:3-hydroxyacyl-[acyl-carrier-protein] dehydratase